MTSIKWAVVYFYYHAWNLNCEVWKDNIDTILEAEQYRTKELEADVNLEPQNVQTIQYKI